MPKVDSDTNIHLRRRMGNFTGIPLYSLSRVRSPEVHVDLPGPWGRQIRIHQGAPLETWSLF